MLMSHSQRNAGLIFVGAIAVRLVFHAVTGFAADDAFITFRYAENIAFGRGFVYNTGSPVLGTSSPLFTLVLSFFALVKIGVVHGALLVSLAASGVTAALVYRFAERLRFGNLWVVPVLLYVLWPRLLPAETSGMETAFFTMLVMTALYYRLALKPYYALAAATLSAVTRPEGGFLLLLIMIDAIYRYRYLWRRFVAIPAAIVIPWVAFATWYFGSPVPHSITAKLALYGAAGAGTPLERVSYLLGLGQPYGWLLVVMVLIGARWLRKTQAFGGLELIWLAGMVGLYTFSTTKMFFWYPAPLYPLLLLFASAAVAAVFYRFNAVDERRNNLVPVISLVVIVGLGAVDIGNVRRWRDQQERIDNTHRAIAWHIRTRSQEWEEIAAEDIGYIGYYSQRRILDRDGLVSPEAVPYNRAGEYGQLIYDYQPEWVVTASNSPISGFVSDSTFLARYELSKGFKFAPGVVYEVFERADRETESR